MPKGKIILKYDKKTGKYEIIFDMEQETINLREHDRIHDKEFVRKIVGDKMEVIKEEESGSVNKSEEEVIKEEREKVRK